MPDYSYGKIYKVVSPSSGLVYIGSTCQTLSQRMTDHKKYHKKWVKTGVINVSSVYVLECGDAKIHLIEKWPCSSKKELHRREGEHQLKNECVNMCVAGRTPSEWRVAHRDDILKRVYEWRENNKDKVKKNIKRYHLKNDKKLKKKYNCECGGRYTWTGKSQHFKTKMHQAYEKLNNS